MKEKGRILLRKEIIDKVWATFSKETGIEEKDYVHLVKKLMEFFEKQDNPDFKKKYISIVKDFAEINKDKKLKDALTFGKKLEYGAVEPVRNLLCYYAYKGMDYKTVVEKVLKSTVEKEILNNNIKKGISPSQNWFAKIYQEPFDTSKGNYNILILSFPNAEKPEEISPVGETFAKGLKAKNEEYRLGLDIKYRPDIKSDEAREVGKKIGADLIIWGSDSKLEGNPLRRIYFRYMYLFSQPGFEDTYIKGKTEKYETDRLVEMREGNLHLEIDDAICWFVGTKLTFENKIAESIYFFEKITDTKHIDAQLQNQLPFYYILASSHLRLKNFERANFYYEKALVTNPDLDNLHCSYAYIRHLHFRDFAKAKKHYEIALNINNLNALTHCRYGFLLEEKHFNDAEGAQKHYNIALKSNSLSKEELVQIHLDYSDFAFNDIERTLKHISIAIMIIPTHPEANYLYALILAVDERVEDRPKAKVHYLKAIYHDPNLKNKNLDIILGIK